MPPPRLTDLGELTVGAYIGWSFFAHFAAMALLALILYRNRHLLRRVPKE